MRKTDIFAVILTASIGTLITFILVNSLLGDPNDQSVTFNTVEAVDSALTDPDPEIFNADAINPTVEVYVGESQTTETDEGDAGDA